ncbi:hypothetical protein D918_09062, partial [Trichuris suis]
MSADVLQIVGATNRQSNNEPSFQLGPKYISHAGNKYHRLAGRCKRSRRPYGNCKPGDDENFCPKYYEQLIQTKSAERSKWPALS